MLHKPEMTTTVVSNKSLRSDATNLDLTGFAGLSEDEARRILAEDGPNEIAAAGATA